MGGKSKQSQRTKNNARPSNSGRSAEILNNVNKFDSSMSSLGNSKMLPLFPTLATANLEQGLTTEYALCMKKLGKKDPITKTKALQELCELVNNSELDDTVAVLPSWAHHYRNLSADSDHKVREATQLAHASLVSTCGRRIAPLVRSLLPAWLSAQHDAYAPASAVAEAALNKTFPDNKIPEVMAYCKTEVIQHLQDYLIGNVEIAVSKRIENAEDREIQVVRLITSGLQGLSFFLEHLPSEHDDWLWAELTVIMNNNSFWKHATNKSIPLRATWFACLGLVIARFPAPFGAQFGAKSTRLLLGACGQRDNAQSVWTCLLVLMFHVKEWRNWIDKKESFVKKVIDVLDNGGWGDARSLSNMMLPLLAHLPSDMLTKQFYEAFFNALYNGLERKSVMSSKIERQAWLTSLSECVRYLSIQNYDFTLEVTTSVHRIWLETILKSRDQQTKNNLIKHSITNMVSILKYWLKQSKEENSEVFDQLVRNYWQNFASILTRDVANLSIDSKEITEQIDGHVLVMQCLRSSFLQEERKPKQIKFDGDVVQESEKVQNDVPKLDGTSIERFNHNLNDLIERVCSQYFEVAKEKQVANAVFSSLVTLLHEFDSVLLFSALARHFGSESVYGLYERELRSWLAGDTMRCKALAEIVFLMLKHMTEDEMKKVFDSFEQFPPSVVEWCISLALSHPYNRLAPSREWLKSATVRHSVVSVALRAIEYGDCAARNIVLICLSLSSDGELAISKEAVSETLKTLSLSLQDLSAERLDQNATLCAQVLSSLSTEQLEEVSSLGIELFKLNLYIKRGDPKLSVETWCDVRSSWQDLLCSASEQSRGLFVSSAVKLIHDTLKDNQDLHLNNLQHVSTLSPFLLNDFTETQIPDSTSEIITLTKILFDFEQNANEISLQLYSLRHDCIYGKLNCPFDDDNAFIKQMIDQSINPAVDQPINTEELSKSNFLSIANRLLYRAMYLKSIITHKIDTEIDTDWSDTLFSEEYFVSEFGSLLHDHAVIESLNEGYVFWPHYNIIKETKSKLDFIIAEIISEISPQSKEKMEAFMSEMAATRGYYWSYGRRNLELRTQGTVDRDVIDDKSFDVGKLGDIVTGNGFFHTLQANSQQSASLESRVRCKFLLMLRSFHVAHAGSAVVDEAFVQDALQCHSANDLDVIVNAYYRHNHTMLYETDVSAAEWRQVVSNAAIVDFLCEVIEARGWELPSQQWDFATIALCSLLCSIEKSKERWGSLKVSVLARPVFRLYTRIKQFVASINAECVKREPSAHVANLNHEWKDIFAPDLNSNLFAVLIQVLESRSPSISASQAAFLHGLAAAVPSLEWGAVPAPHRAERTSLRRVAALCAEAYAAPSHRGFHFLAFHSLEAVARSLVEQDGEKLSLWNSEQNSEVCQLDLALLSPVLQKLLQELDLALSKPADSVPREALSCLLLAHNLLGACALAGHNMYLAVTSKHKFVDSLMSAVVRLLPAEVLDYARDSGNGQPPKKLKQLFQELPAFGVNVPPAEAQAGQLASRLLAMAVGGPCCSEVRAFCASAAANASRLVHAAVALFVTPELLAKQFRELLELAKGLEDTEVAVRSSTLEVEVRHLVDTQTISLVISLSRSHPLVLPKTKSEGAFVSNTQWIALYLGYQSGSLPQCVRLWHENMSRRSSAAPQCYICYAPSLSHTVCCRQCNNHYHKACLHKWFTTSNKSNCPLCRASF